MTLLSAHRHHSKDVIHNEKSSNDRLISAPSSPLQQNPLNDLLDLADSMAALNPLQTLERREDPDPFILKRENSVSLHHTDWFVQSEMHLDTPDDLALGYTRTMMGFLLFNPEPKHVVMVGLGGGSLAKYCYRQLPYSSMLVLENDERILAMREYFLIPKNDDRFRAVLADGADVLEFVSTNRADVLLADGFDRFGQPPGLCSQSFYEDCFAALAADGVLVVNLLGLDRRIDEYIVRIRQSFNNAVVVCDALGSFNKIVFAFKGALWDLPDHVINGRLLQLASDHNVNLNNTAHAILLQRRLARLPG